LITAGTVARTTRRFFQNLLLALALARRLFGSGDGRVGSGGALVTLSLAIALALRSALFFALVGSAITLGSLPGSPLPGGLLARGGTVAGVGSGRTEPAFTALDQAAAAAMGTPALTQESLTGRGRVRIVEAVHGRVYSLVVKSRGEGSDFPPRRLHTRRSGSPGRGVRCRSVACGGPACRDAGIVKNGKEMGANPAINRSRIGSSGSAKVAQFLTATDTCRCRRP
jgi:hypothetical protein